MPSVMAVCFYLYLSSLAHSTVLGANVFHLFLFHFYETSGLKSLYRSSILSV